MTTTVSSRGGNAERILVVGPPFVGYTKMVADGFAELGLATRCVEWKRPNRSPLDHVKSIVSDRYVRTRNEDRTVSCARALEREILSEKPDYVLVMDGNEITKRTARFCLERGIVLALWAFDSVCNFPWIAKAARNYSLAFTHEPDDLDILSVKSPAQYLPMAYSPKLYFPFNSNATFDADVFFAGSIRSNYPERTKTLRSIGRAFPSLRIRVFSLKMPFYSPHWIQDILIQLAGDDSKVNRGGAGHREINEMYNRSKICINIHNCQSSRAVSPRTFEVLGSGCLLLTDRIIPNCTDLRANHEYLHYANEHEMLATIKSIIDDEKDYRNMAIRGHQRAIQGHTYVKRAEVILRALRGASS